MVKVLDVKTKRTVAKSVTNSTMEDILKENRIIVDEFGNLKNYMGEFLQFHLSNLVMIGE